MQQGLPTFSERPVPAAKAEQFGKTAAPVYTAQPITKPDVRFANLPTVAPVAPPNMSYEGRLNGEREWEKIGC